MARRRFTPRTLRPSREAVRTKSRVKRGRLWSDATRAIQPARAKSCCGTRDAQRLDNGHALQAGSARSRRTAWSATCTANSAGPLTTLARRRLSLPGHCRQRCSLTVHTRSTSGSDQKYRPASATANLLRPSGRPGVIVVLIATEMSRAVSLLRHRTVRHQRACHSV